MAISENWTRENLAWAAGLFEGEGSITITKSGAVLVVNMTDKDVLERFSAILGMGKLYGPIKPRIAHHKEQWLWKVGAAHETQAVLAAFWCFLGSRRKARAEEAIRFLADKKVYARYRDFCKLGHAYTAENTRLDLSGSPK